MIYTGRTITVGGQESIIDKPILLYRGDRDVLIEFTLLGDDYSFANEGNIIKSTNASHGQLVLNTPSGKNMFTDVTKCEEGKVKFLITYDMIDELDEVGFYSFQIRLFDEAQRSRVSIPPVMNGFELRRPIAAEDENNLIGLAYVDYSVIQNEEEIEEIFNEFNQYIRTGWQIRDVITSGKLNKIETALYEIHENAKRIENEAKDRDNENKTGLDSTIYQAKNELNSKIDLVKQELQQKDSELNNNISDVNRVLSTKADVTYVNNKVFNMSNMGQDIKEAMTGGSVAVVGTDAVDTVNILNNAVTEKKVDSRILPTFIYSDSGGVVDFEFNDTEKTLTITLPATAYLTVGSNYYLIGTNNAIKTHVVPYPESLTGVTTLWWNKSTSKFIIANYRDTTLVKDKIDTYFIGTVSMRGRNINVGFPYTVNGKYQYNADSLIDKSIKSSKIADYSIVSDKYGRQSAPITLCGTGQITYKFISGETLQLTLPAHLHAMIGLRYIRLTNQAVTYNITPPSPNDGINAIVFDTTNSECVIYNYTEFPKIFDSNNHFVIGTVEYVNKTVYIKGAAKDVSSSDEYVISFNGEIIVDKVNNLIKIPNMLVMKNGMTHKDVKPSRCGLEGLYFEFPLSKGYDVQTILFNKKVLNSWNNDSTENTNPFIRYTQAALPDLNSAEVVISSIYGYATSNYQYKVINGLSDSVWGTVCSRAGCMNFDTKNGIITFPQENYVMYNTHYYDVNYDNMEGANKRELHVTTKNDGIQWLLFNKSTRQFITRRFGSSITNGDYIWIATFWYGKESVQSISPYSINGLPMGINSGSSNQFDVSNSKLVLPDNVYLVKGESIPLYISGAIPKDTSLDTIKPSIIYKKGNTRCVDDFRDKVELVTDNMDTSFRLGYRQYKDNKLYYKDIDITKKDSATITNKKPKILHIGDSITNRYIAARNEVFLKEWGVTPSYVGTIDNQGGKRGEGREGWEYTNFIGMSNIWGNNNSIITPDVASTTTNLNTNPFIKKATAEDISSYPDWCFTNTGVLRETSYTNAEDKTQSFYIFDIKNYLTVRGISTPDVITIALSTNDINRRTDWLDTCLFSMDVMIRRIREQLPNTKIGIIPSPAWGMGNATFNNRVVEWIEKCTNTIKTNNYGNVYIVPIWCHINKEWGFPLTSSNLSDTNDSKVATISDTIHLSTYGQEQYGKAIAMFIANMI